MGGPGILFWSWHRLGYQRGVKTDKAMTFNSPQADALFETYRDQWVEHLEGNQPDLEYQISLIDGEIAQLFCQNYGQDNRKRIKTGLLIVELIERQILDEATYLAKQQLEDQGL